MDEERDGSRPQTVLLALLGAYVLGRDVRVATAGVLELLRRAEVSEQAARSTLSRMARRGLLERTRRGREVYLGLTPLAERVLTDGGERMWHTGPVNDGWDGTWTLLSYSLPDSWTRQRHALRARLVWAGFGSLRGGLWLAAGPVDVAAVVDGLEAAAHLSVFTATALPPTDVDALVRDAWDLTVPAGDYERFVRRWSDPVRAPADPLARQVLLEADWLRAIRHDPRLPVGHLPASWPAPAAHALFLRRHGEVAPEAARVAAEILRSVPAGVS
ncbi:PaaX family transcriptional regulator C-terminal domain-containing protein [Pseudonocardia broussonetiae]|uniref:PaaX family transcriptional regulator n=1 Tax=Pseudonocardia broussonetiae TaxID=2736640 RepID=A0A6M6JDU9_9PSEU|nr:PaaX family transcriptional regulator C-terminal domain-containing protein [Pseudonocardia broussonetiae]QJY44609.1 PaaX family transcriptional regulator [Pseudonocardia broussonetiae]